MYSGRMSSSLPLNGGGCGVLLVSCVPVAVTVFACFMDHIYLLPLFTQLVSLPIL